MLDNFRKIDLVWNNAYEKLKNVRTAQFDEKGRKLVVQVTDDGDIVDLTGVDLKLVTVDGLEVGGRNYYVISDKPWYPQLEYEGDNLWINNVTNVAFAYLSMSKVNLKKDENYTISFWVKVNSDNIQFAVDRLYINPSVKEKYNRPTLIKDEWVKVYGTFKYSVTGGIAHVYINNMENKGDVEFKDFKIERGTKPTDWTPAPEDLQFPFDLIDAQKGIYELYFPKFFVDRYAGDTKVFLELTTKDFSVTSEPFYINVFEGVR